jgi:hypothetical protein
MASFGFSVLSLDTQFIDLTFLATRLEQDGAETAFAGVHLSPTRYSSIDLHYHHIPLHHHLPRSLHLHELQLAYPRTKWQGPLDLYRFHSDPHNEESSRNDK